MSDKARAMILASFVADSLALGVHWIYSTDRIARDFGRIENYIKPGQGSYHPTKDKGDFTHYGDQAFVLLESVSANKGFVLKDFVKRWQNLYEEYRGYLDQATRHTLANLENGISPEDAGSSSNDIAGAARIAPLIYFIRDDADALVKACRDQTAMTHRDSNTIDASEFFSLACLMVLEGKKPSKALKDLATGYFAGSDIGTWVVAGLKSIEQGSIDAIKNFGQSCHTPEAFGGVVHLIAKYEDNLKEALIQSVMAGGDSAARGMLVGMVLGAHLGMEAIPHQWIADMKKARQVMILLE